MTVFARSILRTGFATALALAAGFANAAEIKVLSTMALRPVLEELLPQFERAHGHRVVIDYDTANIMANRVRAGAAVDLAIVTPALLAELAVQNRVVAGSNVTLARSGVGIVVRKGALKPDISTVDTLKRALLEAKSIAYTTTGQSGTYFAGLIERLGIAAEVKAKARTPAGGSTGELVAKGEAEMAVQQIPELLATPGVDYVGPLPPSVQNMTPFAAGVTTVAKEPAAARALIEFLQAPAAARVMREKGLEPGA